MKLQIFKTFYLILFFCIYEYVIKYVNAILNSFIQLITGLDVQYVTILESLCIIINNLMLTVPYVIWKLLHHQ